MFILFTLAQYEILRFAYSAASLKVQAGQVSPYNSRKVASGPFRAKLKSDKSTEMWGGRVNASKVLVKRKRS